MMEGFGESVKKLLLAGIGAAATTAEKSKELLDDMVEKGELTVEQGKIINEELKHDIKGGLSIWNILWMYKPDWKISYGP